MNPAALRRVLHNPGFWLGMLTLGVLLAAYNTGEVSLYQFGVLLVATLVAGYWLPSRNIRGVSVSRQLPEESHEGDEIEVTLRLRARGFFARYMLQIRDLMPFLDQPDYPVLIARLSGTQQFRYRIRCERRGVHTIGPLVVRSEFPLALLSVSTRLDDSLTEMRVLPSTFPISGMPLSGRGGFPTDSHQIGPVSRGQDSFAGVREYRRGDSMRHIHWRASARRGEWIVREYEQIENVELIVVLDAQPEANVGRGRESCFEYAVRIAASLAQFAIDNGHRVGVFCLQPSGARWLAPDSGWHHYRHLLEYLSEVEADCRLPYLQAVEQAAALAGRQGRLLLFHTVETPGDMPATPLPSQRIDQRPMQVLFDAGSFRHPPGTDPDRRSGPIGDSLYWVQSGASLSEVFGR